MTPEQFTYWLQGFVEINGYNGNLSGDQWKVICDHLKTVFHKVTPTYPPPALIPLQPDTKRFNPYNEPPSIIC